MLREPSPYRDSISARPAGGYDLGGVWRPDNIGTSAIHFNTHAYDRNLHAPYYAMEDDYYGAYGDLLEYERALRVDRQLSEHERLERWRMRLAFEELEDAERMRRYEMMNQTERIMLGLAENSWWNERYGRHHHDHHHHHHSDWRARYGAGLRGWGADQLPLTSQLSTRFSRVWSPVSELAQTERRLDAQIHRIEHNLHRDRSLDAERRRSQLIAEDLRHSEMRLEDEERRLADEIAFERERRLEDRLDSEMLYDQERRIRDDEELYRAERRLDDEERYEDSRRMVNDELLRERAIENYESGRDFNRLDESISFNDPLARAAVRDEMLLERDCYGQRDTLY